MLRVGKCTKWPIIFKIYIELLHGPPDSDHSKPQPTAVTDTRPLRLPHYRRLAPHVFTSIQCSRGSRARKRTPGPPHDQLSNLSILEGTRVLAQLGPALLNFMCV